MKSLPQLLIDKLAERSRDNSLRQLRCDTVLADFSSNDYLGFSLSKLIFDGAHQYLLQNNIINNGATGSRLISGNHGLYTITERYLAAFHKADAALIFNSGYDANMGFFSCVPQKGDVVLYDEYIHASIRDGMRLSNAAAYKFAHNDIEALTTAIKRHREKITGGEVFVVTESVFSMDGDSPNLQQLAALCATFNCRLVVDEAHALGVFGTKGEGLVQSRGLEEKVFATIVTFGKGLGCHGAAILGSAQLKRYLVNYARSFIYTTGLPPHSLATILTAYNYLEQSSGERQALQDIVVFFKSEVKRHGLHTFINSDAAIHCAVIPGNEKVKSIAIILQQNGFGVKPILSPTVPQGEERLRFCLHSYNTKEQIIQMLELLTQALLSS